MDPMAIESLVAALVASLEAASLVAASLAAAVAAASFSAACFVASLAAASLVAASLAASWRKGNGWKMATDYRKYKLCPCFSIYIYIYI